jgi:hypothetical protein
MLAETAAAAAPLFAIDVWKADICLCNAFMLANASDVSIFT